MRKLYEFNLKSVFRPDDSISLVLLILMAGFNDLMTAYGCYKIYESDPKNRADQLINYAKRLYFFRLTCGHLYEILESIKEIKDDKDFLILLNNMTGEGRGAYQNILAISPMFHKQLCLIRNNAVFHYTNKKGIKKSVKGIKKSVKDFNSAKETFVIADKTYETRFIVADDVINNLISFYIGRDVIEIEKMIQQVVKIQGSIARLVDCLFASYIKERRLISHLREKIID